MAGLTRIPRGLILPSSGGGQAYAERTTATSALGSAVADIPSLTISPVPDSAQMLLVLHLPRLDKDGTAGFVIPSITDSGGTAYGTTLFTIVASAFASNTLLALVTGLTPGTALTGIKGRIQTSAGAVTVQGAATQRPFLAALRA